MKFSPTLFLKKDLFDISVPVINFFTFYIKTFFELNFFPSDFYSHSF